MKRGEKFISFRIDSSRTHGKPLPAGRLLAGLTARLFLPHPLTSVLPGLEFGQGRDRHSGPIGLRAGVDIVEASPKLYLM